MRRPVVAVKVRLDPASAEAALKRLSGADRDDDEAVEQALSRALKKAAYRIWERRPVVETTVLRV